MLFIQGSVNYAHDKRGFKIFILLRFKSIVGQDLNMRAQVTNKYKYKVYQTISPKLITPSRIFYLSHLYLQSLEKSCI